jgi:acetylglutamate kinase
MRPSAENALGAVLTGLKRLYPWRGRTVVVKYGGAAMEQADLRATCARDVVHLQAVGVYPVIVHGGGPQIDALVRRVGKTPRFVDGLRFIDEETMELVEMVLVGRINTEIVGLINKSGGRAIGLNGKDADLIVAHRQSLDLGLVGEVDRVNTDPSSSCRSMGCSQ